MDWYNIHKIAEIDSPSLVLYRDRMEHNLKQMIRLAGEDTSRLMPHIKTNKMPRVIQTMLGMGIKRFKASTIAEVEMAAREGAEAVLLSHQPVGPKLDRLIKLICLFPEVEITTIVDNLQTTVELNSRAEKAGINIGVFIDVNNGMNRSGIEPGNDLRSLADAIKNYDHLIFKGLHVYDGHLRDSDFNTRKEKIESGFDAVTTLFEELKTKNSSLQMIAGGTPAYTSHVTEKSRICSPGTCVFWDWGYGDQLKEQPFKHAVLLITRVISKPTEGIVTVDMGHKAVASENLVSLRVKFLNLEGYELISQSEEHGVLKVKDWDRLRVGDVLYGIPYHICPTINLYDEVSVIEEGFKTDTWEITARRRKLEI